MFTSHESVLKFVIYRMVWAGCKFLLACIAGIAAGLTAVFVGWCALEWGIHTFFPAGLR
jgi:hypothetical protein